MNPLIIESIVVRYLAYGPEYRGRKINYLFALVDLLVPDRDPVVPRCPFCGRVFRNRGALYNHMVKAPCSATVQEIVDAAVRLHRIVSGKFKQRRRGLIYEDGDTTIVFPSYKAMCKAFLSQINGDSYKKKRIMLSNMGAR